MDTSAHKPSLFNQYGVTHGLHQNGNIIAEYIWIDGTGINIRSKCRTLEKKVEKLEDIPNWNYDGSSCYQAPTENSEIVLKPVAYFSDPFRQGDNIIVMCSTYRWTDKTYTKQEPANTNFRHFAEEVWARCPEEEPWYGIEQEYQLIGTQTKFTTWPLGWPNNGYPSEQGPYYCSVGANVNFGRVIADSHYKACLYAGIKCSGTNAENMPGQWEFQVGPCLGVSVGDHLNVARYLLMRVAEDHGVTISFKPKVIEGWSGAGCHCNFSTKTMRAGTKGWKYIDDMMERFEEKHDLHMSVYGEGNKQRMSGAHETAAYDEFSYGVGNRAASFRIPTEVANAGGKGYIEDRRPGSNIDPYLVAALVFDSGVIDGLVDDKTAAQPLLDHYFKWQEWIKDAKIVKV